MKIYNFNNSQTTYPIVLLPNKILENIVEGIDVDLIKKELELKEPRKRNIYAPTYPSKFKKIEYEKLSFWELGSLVDNSDQIVPVISVG